ncbi:hypothetical protein B0H17DRAFT_488811 [Mycena rosella]|uniref:Uncharacterized protein n=1 Tax=Mycena rosella TaxID=1033263 RepID=A0AAD7DKK7_MYCRO|nr:hypothetical protein B0H17DRAFT_488811 [Mycena rosella]
MYGGTRQRFPCDPPTVDHSFGSWLFPPQPARWNYSATGSSFRAPSPQNLQVHVRPDPFFLRTADAFMSPTVDSSAIGSLVSDTRAPSVVSVHRPHRVSPSTASRPDPRRHDLGPICFLSLNFLSLCSFLIFFWGGRMREHGATNAQHLSKAFPCSLQRNDFHCIHTHICKTQLPSQKTKRVPHRLLYFQALCHLPSGFPLILALRAPSGTVGETLGDTTAVKVDVAG